MSLIFKNDIAVCPHCGQLAGFGVDSRVQVLPDLGEWGDEDYEAITAQREHRAGATEVIVVSCKACGDAVVLMDIWGKDEDQSQPIVRKMIAPARSVPAIALRGVDHVVAVLRPPEVRSESAAHLPVVSGEEQFRHVRRLADHVPARLFADARGQCPPVASALEVSQLVNC